MRCGAPDMAGALCKQTTVQAHVSDTKCHCAIPNVGRLARLQARAKALLQLKVDVQ